MSENIYGVVAPSGDTIQVSTDQIKKLYSMGKIGKGDVFSKPAVSETIQNVAAPYTAGTAEESERLKAEQYTKDAQQFEADWDSMDIGEKTLYLMKMTGKSDYAGLHSTIAAFPHSALDMARRNYLGDEPSALRGIVTAGQDLLSAPGRAIAGGLDMLGAEDDEQDFMGSMSKRGSEVSEGQDERSFVGGIGHDALRDWTNIPLGFAGAPLAKAVAPLANAVTGKVVMPMAVKAVKYAPKILKPATRALIGRPATAIAKPAITGAIEGMADAGMHLAEEQYATGDADWGQDLTVGALAGGTLNTLGSAASDLVGSHIQRSGMLDLERATPKKYGITPLDEVPSALRKAETNANRAAREQRILHEAKYGPQSSNPQPNRPVDFDGTQYQSIPSNYPTALAELKKLGSAEQMAQELDVNIKGLDEMKRTELQTSQPMDEVRHTNLFESTEAELRRLFDEDQIVASDLATGLATLRKLKSDYPLENFTREGMQGAEPLLDKRQLMDKRQKFNTWVGDDGKIGVKDPSKPYNGGELARSIFRKELNTTMGELAPQSRLIDRTFQQPLIGPKKALEGLKDSGAKSVFTGDFNPMRYLRGIDPNGTLRIKYGEKLLPTVDDAVESAFLRRNSIPLTYGKGTPVELPSMKRRKGTKKGKTARRAANKAVRNEVDDRWDAYIKEQEEKKKLEDARLRLSGQ